MIKVLLISLWVVQGVHCANYGDARIWNMKICNGKNFTLRGSAQIRNITDGQSIKALMYMSEDFGDDNKYSCKAFRYLGGKRKPIVNISGKGACTALNTYGSTFWWEIEKVLGNPKPSYCPVEAKDYVMDWYPMKYSEFSLLALVPIGQYSIDCTLYDPKGKLLKACLSFDAMKTK